MVSCDKDDPIIQEEPEEPMEPEEPQVVITYDLELTNLTAAVDENVDNGYLAGTMSVTSDTSISSFQILETNVPFSINNLGEIQLDDADGLNYEQIQAFEFRVVVEDAIGQKDTADILLNVNNVDESPQNLKAYYDMNWSSQFANMVSSSNIGTGYPNLVPVNDREGNPSAAVNFQSGHVEIDSPADFNNMTEFSLSTWIKVDSIPGTYVTIISKSGPGSGDDDFSFKIRNNGQVWVTFTGTRNGSNNSSGYAVFDSNIQLDQWYHLVATYDGTHFKIYINGQPRTTSKPSVDIALKWTSTKMQIGKNRRGEHMYGDLDDVMVINGTLTNEVIERWFEDMTF